MLDVIATWRRAFATEVVPVDFEPSDRRVPLGVEVPERMRPLVVRLYNVLAILRQNNVIPSLTAEQRNTLALEGSGLDSCLRHDLKVMAPFLAGFDWYSIDVNWQIYGVSGDAKHPDPILAALGHVPPITGALIVPLNKDES